MGNFLSDLFGETEYQTNPSSDDPSTQGMSNYGNWNKFWTPNQEFWQTDQSETISQPQTINGLQALMPKTTSLLDLLSQISSYQTYKKGRY